MPEKRYTEMINHYRWCSARLQMQWGLFYQHFYCKFTAEFFFQNFNQLLQYENEMKWWYLLGI